ncbi:hypothetical protein [Vibrio crassostreae]|uniref:hypothetical protein n=1 Tax=Vibrio crassostreae TaxID=246167 RepID=UPI001B30CA4F|nr:hypothetical protein [Vibrio crassostreae]
MGDWEKFCEANGAPLDWEPWNSPSWGQEYDDEFYYHENNKRLKIENYKKLCEKVIFSIKEIELLYKKDIDVRVSFDIYKGRYNFKIYHKVNSVRCVMFLITLNGVHKGVPLILRRFINDIRFNRLDYLSCYGLELEEIHSSYISSMYRFKPIHTVFLIDNKFHCDGRSI